MVPPYSAEGPSRLGNCGISGGSDSLSVTVIVRRKALLTSPTNCCERCLEVCKSTGYRQQDQMTNQQQLSCTRHFNVYILHVPLFILLRVITGLGPLKSALSPRVA